MIDLNDFRFVWESVIKEVWIDIFKGFDCEMLIDLGEIDGEDEMIEEIF